MNSETGRHAAIPAIVLAAGFSTRMGRPKALLEEPLTGDPFVQCVVRSLQGGGVREVFVVGRPEDDALREIVSRLEPRVAYVENIAASRGQLSSVLAGLDALDERRVTAVMITPVDLPRVAAPSIRAVVAAFRRGTPLIARATFQGRHGHPVVFDRRLFDELRRADPLVGARAVVRSHAVLDVEVDDPGVVHDVDTPEDYARLARLPPGSSG